MTPEISDAIATIRRALRFVHVEPDRTNAIVALNAIMSTLEGEAEVRRNHLAYIGQLRAALAKQETAP